MTDDDVARLAAIDQQLAGLGDRLDRNARSLMRGDAILLLVAPAAIIYYLAARPAVSYWHLVIAWAVVALGAAGSLVQGLKLRSYRAEIRELRAR